MKLSASLTVSAMYISAVLVMWVRPSAESKGFDWNEQNCSAMLHVPLASGGDRTTQSLPLDLDSDRCPPWYGYNPLNGTCSFADSLHGRVCSVKNTLQTAVLQCYCMTNDSSTHELAVTACPYTCLVDAGYYTLPCRANKVENFTCGQMKRTGLACGDCVPDFAPPVYSYTSHCVECRHINVAANWIKYLTIAFLPLTLFTLIVIIFQIKATSPYLFSYIFIVQTVTQSCNMRLIQTLFENGKIKEESIPKIGLTIMSFWNLDFFRVYYSSFCLHPSMSTLMANFMDIFVAVYPLILIPVLALLVELGIGRTKFCALMCRPLHSLCNRYGIEWNMRSNLVSAFATFIFLSNHKILDVCFNILLPAYVYPINKHGDKEVHVFSSGAIKYGSGQHIPYVLCCVLFLMIWVVVPLILLCCYPIACFRRVLQKLCLDSDILDSLVYNFSGSYKNKREDGVEYRWFPVAYFLLRIVMILVYGAALSSFYFPIAGVILTAFVVLIAICRPRKSEVHNAIDVYHVMCFLIFILGIMANITANSQTKRKVFLRTSVVIIVISTCLPLFYMAGLIGHGVFYKLGLGRWMHRVLQRYSVCRRFLPQKGYERIVNHYGSFDPISNHCGVCEEGDRCTVQETNGSLSAFTLDDSAVN